MALNLDLELFFIQQLTYFSGQLTGVLSQDHSILDCQALLFNSSTMATWPKICGHLDITLICGSFPKCWQTFGNTHFYRMLLYAVALRFPFTRTKRLEWKNSGDLYLWDKLQSWLNASKMPPKSVPNLTDTLEWANLHSHVLKSSEKPFQ